MYAYVCEVVLFHQVYQPEPCMTYHLILHELITLMMFGTDYKS
jgi:hypothetical protein